MKKLKTFFKLAVTISVTAISAQNQGSANGAAGVGFKNVDDFLRELDEESHYLDIATEMVQAENRFLDELETDKVYSEEELVNALVRMYNANCDGDIMCINFNEQFEKKCKTEGLPEKFKDIALEVAKQYQKEDNEFVNDYSGSGFEDHQTSLDRQINCESPDCKVPQPLWGIWDYGCWCNFGVNLMTGNGAPVNEFDAACKKLQQCQRCTVWDNDCDPRYQEYNAQFGWMISQESLYADCKKQNLGDDCAISSCCCELQLIADILNLMWSSVVYDPTFKHSNGWDRDLHCGIKNNDNNDNGNGDNDNNPDPNGPNPGNLDPGSPGDGSDPDIPKKECCGLYPNRFMYNTNSMACCHDKLVYNAFTQECCADGSSAGIGMCPMNRRKRHARKNEKVKKRKK